MKPDILLSVVTPTYNRAGLLPDCYRSLKKQTDLRFEWIIVDDGSTDDTELVVQEFQAETTLFPIIYVKKENGGKHTALNASHPYIHGKYVAMVDSDDRLTEDAVAVILEGWSSWESVSTVGLVTFLKGTDRDHPNCYAADENVPVDISAYPRVCPISGDAFEIIRSELFLRFPFPVFPGERFLSEGVLWNRVGQTHQCVYINKVIYLCEYLEGGLTKSGRAMRIRNPYGGMCSSNLNMMRKNSAKKRIKNGILFTCYGFFAGLSPRKMAEWSDHKSLMYLCLPFGWLMHRRWKKRYGG